VKLYTVDCCRVVPLAYRLCHACTYENYFEGILWEKSNVQETLLKDGELAIQGTAGALSMSKLDLAEINRQLIAMTGKVGGGASLAETVLLLKDQLKETKKRYEIRS
jgi:hypothetical protein